MMGALVDVPGKTPRVVGLRRRRVTLTGDLQSCGACPFHWTTLPGYRCPGRTVLAELQNFWLSLGCLVRRACPVAGMLPPGPRRTVKAEKPIKSGRGRTRSEARMISNSTLQVAAKVVGAALIAISATALAGDELEFWKLSPGWKFGYIVTPISLGLMGSVGSAITQVKRVRFEERKHQTRFILQTASFRIQDLTGIDTRDLGIAAYATVRWGWCLWPWQERLRPLDRVRPKQSAASGVRWRPGVGIVGQCVKHGKDVMEDLDEFDSRFAGVSKGRRQRMKEDDRLGLAYEEFMKLKGKFGVVMASPIIDPKDSSVLGCVSLDGPAGSGTQLFEIAVRKVLAAAADEVAYHVLS